MRRRAARTAWLIGALLGLSAPLGALAAADAPRTAPALPAFFDDLEKRTFAFFWDNANPANGLVPDRAPGPSAASIAAVGFALTAYPIGVERGYVTREAARARTLATLRFFAHETNQHGFFYHFIDMTDGHRRGRSEISTGDTALLLAGMLMCASYFDRADSEEAELRRLADAIYRRVDWEWAEPHTAAVVMGWTPESGFLHTDWVGYDEGMLIYILALGSPSHRARADAWQAWTSGYGKDWGTLFGQTHLTFAPLFGHQFSHVWIDFRGIRDAYMRARGFDYFENSRRATYAQQRYAIENPMHWQGYGENLWGLTACEGPDKSAQPSDGKPHRFFGYAARGVGVDYTLDDGTIAPSAAVSSLPFAPEIVVPATLEMRRRLGDALYSTYGFRDAFNLSVRGSAPPPALQGWFDEHYLGIDQGPIVAMIENYRSDLVWRIMRGNEYIRRGLKRAGFQGGWLQKHP